MENGLIITNITSSLFKSGSKDTSKEIKKFLRKHGNKGVKIAKKIANSKVKRKTGNYLKAIKKGKVYKKTGDYWTIRVYNNAPHGHLIEDGYDMVRGGKKGKGGKVIGRVSGKKVIAKFQKDYDKYFYNDCENLVDELLEKGFSW